MRIITTNRLPILNWEETVATVRSFMTTNEGSAENIPVPREKKREDQSMSLEILKSV